MVKEGSLLVRDPTPRSGLAGREGPGVRTIRGARSIERVTHVDVVPAAVRSRMMSGIRGRNTRPELTIRQLLFASGFRFRLHRKDLPGKPDIVLPKYRVAIFVHGCFWHRHSGCRFATTPRSNQEFWLAKLEANRLRDQRNVEALQRSGWRVLEVWECATRLLESPLLQKELARLVRASDEFASLEPRLGKPKRRKGPRTTHG